MVGSTLLAAGLLLLPLLTVLGTVVGVLVFTAAFTLVERKLMGLHQRREGPDRVGFEGLGQPFADGLKLLRKETLRPKDSPERRLFLLAPLLSLWVSLTLWALLPFSSAGALSGGEVGLPLLLGLAGLGSYGVIYAGWASNNKYALLGSFRAVAQFVSYELIFSSLFLPLLGAAATANLGALVSYQAAEGWFSYLLPLWGLALLTLLAEANRTPFDLPEAEAELVAGFNVEYSSLLFALFFLAEYGGMGFFSGLLATAFFGGWSGLPWGGAAAATTPAAALGGVLLLSLKIQFGCVVFVFLRAALPRLRFDQLLGLCWKYLFPLVLSSALLALALHHSATLGSLSRLPLPALLETAAAAAEAAAPAAAEAAAGADAAGAAADAAGAAASADPGAALAAAERRFRELRQALGEIHQAVAELERRLETPGLAAAELAELQRQLAELQQPLWELRLREQKAESLYLVELYAIVVDSYAVQAGCPSVPQLWLQLNEACARKGYCSPPTPAEWLAIKHHTCWLVELQQRQLLPETLRWVHGTGGVQLAPEQRPLVLQLAADCATRAASGDPMDLDRQLGDDAEKVVQAFAKEAAAEALERRRAA